MRGSPLFRALVAFAAFAALGWPLWLITHRTATAVPALDDQTVAVQRIKLSLDLTRPARAIEVRHLGHTLWTANPPGTRPEATIELPWPKEGVDLQFQIDWPDDGVLAAARVTIIDPDGTEHIKSIWSRGPANEVLTFP